MRTLAIFFVFSCGCLVAFAQNDGSQQTALDEYVYSEESLSQFSFFHASDYDWTGISPITEVGYTAHVINMTSGEWQTEAEVGIRSLWWHILVLVMPDNLNPAYASHAGLYIGGGSNERADGTGVPDLDGDINLALTLATGAGMPVAALYQIPNAHITFASDPEQQSRSDDDIIAYSWAEHLNDTSNPELNAYMPMARAAVRALDTLTQFSEENLETTIEKFFTTGASKRGWTSWLTGAMAPDRVMAIAPFVWDGINLSEVFHQQYRDYGDWSFAIEPYIENHIVERLDTPEMVELQNLIDPFFYRTRLTMPKFVMTGLMDEFQMPDDEQYWWDEMPAPKWLYKSPNTEHSFLTGLGVALPVIGTWITYMLNDWDIPIVTWEYQNATGDVIVSTHGGDVYSAQMWYAHSCHDRRRDFRSMSLDSPCECGIVTEDGYCAATNELWDMQTLVPNEDGTYTGHVEPLEDGRWTAFVVDIQMTTDQTYSDDPNHTFFTRQHNVFTNKIDPQPRWPITPPGILEFTSRGSIVPNTYPFDDCTQEGCAGDLV